MNRFLAAGLAALVCATVAQGQPLATGQPDAILSLSRALELAGVQSPLVEAARADQRAAEAARTVAGLRPNPSV